MTLINEFIGCRLVFREGIDSRPFTEHDQPCGIASNGGGNKHLASLEDNQEALRLEQVDNAAEVRRGGEWDNTKLLVLDMTIGVEEVEAIRLTLEPFHLFLVVG